jgi:phosphoribosyl 1,2-cyclic phosphodiesterase
MNATLLFTHLHWDHIQGVPFFAPAFHPDSSLTFIGPRRGQGLRDALALQMRPPQFPVSIDRLVGARAFEDLPGGVFEVGPFRITPLEQNHPDGVVVYRIEAGGKVLVFATDTEHGGQVDPAFIALAAGADLLVQDAQYTQGEYLGTHGPSRRGWGHTSWEQAVVVAQRAAVDRLALFHHDPMRADSGVDAIESFARLAFPRTFAAREGMEVAL